MMPGMGGGGMMPGGGQMVVLNKNTKRETGRKAQRSNIAAAVNVASIVRTTLGPKAMLKMLLDPMGGIVMTNDGNAILREIDVGHPAAKNLIELSRAQDEEVGDGTTSVIVLAGEMLSVAEPLLEKNIHPTVIVQGYLRALEDSLRLLEQVAIPIGSEKAKLIEVVQSSIDTKFVSRWGTMISTLAVEAAQCVYEELPSGKKEIDLKRYAKVEKIGGGDLEECTVLKGVMFNKDITHPRMRRKIKNPRVVLLDCPLEYKKGESQTNVEITKETDWEAMLKQEEEEVKRLCDEILRVSPDVVITEKGVSDLAQHFLLKKNISVVRRLRKTDNNRVARVTGATIVNRPEELDEKDVGTGCGLFEVKKIGDEYFTFMTECDNPKACSVILRGASKDVLNEMERNLHDAWNVARNIILEPKLLPGGGATEMHLSAKLKVLAKSQTGTMQYPYQAVASAFEVIPRALAHNCGASVVRLLTDLRSRHGNPDVASPMGIDGNEGKIVDAAKAGILDTFATKAQTIKAAIEAAAMILRIDDIVSGQKSKKGGPAPPQHRMEDGNPNSHLDGEGEQVN
ncbi:unnamed protein product [Amoebophrya sp. A25]|nr:unnamed protein product [Amoebophrya sp. A25]|eukprot:GSA25T00022528001.1